VHKIKGGAQLSPLKAFQPHLHQKSEEYLEIFSGTCGTQPHHFVRCIRKFTTVLGLPWHPSLAAREGFLPPDWP